MCSIVKLDETDMDKMCADFCGPESLRILPGGETYGLNLNEANEICPGPDAEGDQAAPPETFAPLAPAFSRAPAAAPFPPSSRPRQVSFAPFWFRP